VDESATGSVNSFLVVAEEPEGDTRVSCSRGRHRFGWGSGDKGMVFNTDLTQALELGFLLELAECMVVSGLARKEKPRRPRAAVRLP